MSIVGVLSPSISGVEGDCMLISEGWQWGRPSKGEGTSKLLREAKGREYGRYGPPGMRGVAISVREGDTVETSLPPAVFNSKSEEDHTSLLLCVGSLYGKRLT